MDFDGIVIGGGHAGIEAALALSRLNFSCLLITQNLDCIGKMSCNPAIGGLAKGNVVREIDALGGQMAKLIDQSLIQFRILNRSKGPAVQAPRAQADKALYSQLAKWTLEREGGLSLFQDTVVDLLLTNSGREVCGVITERGRRFTAPNVVLTTGTFMEADIFIGEFTASSGRLGEPAAVGLGSALRKLGGSARNVVDVVRCSGVKRRGIGRTPVPRPASAERSPCGPLLCPLAMRTRFDDGFPNQRLPAN